MSNLISKQNTIDVLSMITAKMTEEDAIVMKQAIAVLQDVYPAEPESKRGKWIEGMLYQDFDESEWEKVKCSVCKKFVVKQIFYYDNKYHFCPYCGADMRDEQ